MSINQQERVFMWTMLVRNINPNKWREAYLFMVRCGYRQIIVEEKYLYHHKSDDFSNLSEQFVDNIWVHAILIVDDIPVMVTSNLGPEFAWKSQRLVLNHIRENPKTWLAHDAATLLPVQAAEQGTLTGQLERTVSVPEDANLGLTNPNDLS